MTDPNVSTPSGNVPAWLNALMTMFLKTPGLQKILGKPIALLSFTGRRTGRSYTIPISYERRDDTVLMLTKKTRSWWRNFEDQPGVELRLAGRVLRGTAEAHVGTEQDLEEVAAFLATRPQDAKAYGVTRLSDGSLDPQDIRAHLPKTVVIHVQLP